MDYALAYNINRMMRTGVGGLGGLGSDLRAQVIEALFGNGEQGILIDPSDTSALFQDSAGTTPVTADGQVVKKVLDLSGNGNHLTQTDTAKAPKYRTDGTLHWLEFDSTDDGLLVPQIDITVSPISLFAGVDLTASSQGRYILDIEDGRTILSSNGEYFDGAFKGTATDLTAASVITFLLQSSGSSVRKNASEVFAGTYAEAEIGATGNIYVGRKAQSNGNNLGGKIYGMAIVNTVPASVSEVEDWLAEKSGVTL